MNIGIITGGIIFVDDDNANKIGFTSDKFSKGSFLFRCEEYIYISCIKGIRKSAGYMLDLFKTILNRGYGIKVIKPAMTLQKILIEEKFGLRYELSNVDKEMMEVWRKCRIEEIKVN